MKNTYYFLMIFIGLTIFGCQPMNDVQDAINQKLDSQLAVGDVNYALTADDYAALGLSYPNFNSVDDAKQLIPNFLKENYPTYGATSSANITFDVYSPIQMDSYTATDADYTAAGITDGYVTSTNQIRKLLKNQFPDANEGDYVKLTYKKMADEISYTFSKEDYVSAGTALDTVYPKPAAGAAKYYDFEKRDGNDAYWSNDMILEAINIVLSDQFPDVAGQTYSVSYTVYNGSASTESMTVKFDGNNYVAIGGTKYQLVNSDYELAGAELADSYPGPAGNAAEYHSFTTQTTNDNYWSPDMLVEAFNVILNNAYPDAADGAQFEVTYKIYDGTGTSFKVMSLVKKDGTFIEDTNATVSTIEKTDTFAFTSGTWNMPYELQDTDYTEMGLSYPDFSNTDDAYYKIGIFLNQHFPYAEEGDLMAVAYDLYVHHSDGTSSIDTKYANFVFKNGSWGVVPSVKEQTIKFGNVNGTWEPDNTIKYTLSGEDYTFIGNHFSDASQYPDYGAAAAGLLRYPDFDTRDWKAEMILEAMNVLLDQKVAPNAEEGQKYLITYATYNGSNGNDSIYLIKTDGKWVVFN